MLKCEKLNLYNLILKLKLKIVTIYIFMGTVVDNVPRCVLRFWRLHSIDHFPERRCLTLCPYTLLFKRTLSKDIRTFKS